MVQISPHPWVMHQNSTTVSRSLSAMVPFTHAKRGTGVATITGGLQIVNNNGANFGTVPTDAVSADETWYMNSADTSGNALDVTDTAGTFTVKGGKVAYAISGLGTTVYYSIDGKLTVPAGTYTVNYADDLDAVIDTVVPFEDSASEFVEWIDDGNGTLTASYRATGIDIVYYVQHGATGSGLTIDALGSFATVVDYINKYYDADDTVTIKIVKAANEADSYTDTSAIALASIKDIPAREAMLVVTSADPENPSWLTHINSYVTSGYVGSNIELSGPLTLENIKIVDPRMDYHCDLYVNAHNFKVGEGVKLYRPTYSSSTLKLNGKAWTGSIAGGSRGKTDAESIFDRAFTMEFNGDVMQNNIISASGYHEAVDKNMKQDITLRFGKGTASAVRVDGMANDSSKSYYTHTVFDKNVNFVFNGTTVTKLYNTSDGTIVKGAVQIIKNNGATVASNTPVTYTTEELDVETPVYDITVETGITLDVTETAGVYTVEGSNVAYVVSEDTKSIIYSVDGVLTLPEAGAYTVKNAADIDAVKTANTPTLSIKYSFVGWEDDGKGKLTAKLTENTDPEISLYYVQYGATGTGLTYDSPVGTIEEVIKAINADGWGEGENVTVYLVPTGNEPTKEQLDLTAAKTGVDAPITEDTILGFIWYQTPNVAHKATITYTTYNYGAEGVEKMILSNGNSVASSNHRDGSTHMFLCGPTVFKDIYVIDIRMDGSAWDFYTQSHNFELYNVDWRKTTRSGKLGYTGKAWNSHFYLGNHSSLTHTQNANSDGVVIVDNPSFMADLNLICKGEKTGTSYAYFGNDTTASTIPIVYNTNSNTAIQHGVANYIFNNTTITNLINKTEKIDTDGDNKGDTTVEMTYPTADAVQIILNNGSSITTNTADFNTDVYLIKVADGDKLDATEEVGVYTVDTDKKYIYVFSGEETISYTADDATIYYAMYGGNGDGRTPDAPANTVAEAIDSINADVAAGKLSAGQEVTVYVRSADDWQTFNSTWGLESGTDEFNAVPQVGGGEKQLHHMTPWKHTDSGNPGGNTSPAAYSVVLNVKSYDSVNISYVPSNQWLGLNESLDINGTTNFDHVALVDTRYGYREFETHGNNVTFGKNTVFAHLDVGQPDSSKVRWNGKFGLDADNITVGNYSAATYSNDVVQHYNNSFNILGNDRGVFLGGSVSNANKFNGNVSVYFDNPDIQTTLQWQGLSVFNKNLNLIFNDATLIQYRTKNSSTMTINNLQMIVADGITFKSTANSVTEPEALPSNVTITGGKWVLKLAEGVDNFLDVTDTAGTFKVETGAVAVATNVETNEVVKASNELVLDAGVYTITKLSKDEVADLSVTVTFDGISDGNTYISGGTITLPEKEDTLFIEFKGWTLNGGETILPGGSTYTFETAGETYAFTSVVDNYENTSVVFVDSVNGSDDKNDGLVEARAFKTLSKAFTTIDAAEEDIKKVVIIGEYEHSAQLPANTNPIIITGDGSGNSVLHLYNDSIYLNGDVKFENIKLTHTTSAGGKILYSDSYELAFGENVVTDSDYTVRLGGDHSGRWGNELTATFESGTFSSLEIGNFWVPTTRATASGADVVIDGASITTVAFTSNGYLNTHVGCDFTGPVKLTVNSGYVKTISVTTEADNASKYATFQDTVDILTNNGTVTTIEDRFTATNGAWIVKAAAATDGSYLERGTTIGTYNVVGSMTALATDKDGQQYVSMDGVLTLPAGNYTVEFVDKIDYLLNGDKVTFYSTCTVDISTIKVPLHDGKAFIGWFYNDGTAPKYSADGTAFVPGDVLTANYIDYTEEYTGSDGKPAGDFFIMGAKIRLGSTEKDTENGLRYVVEMDDSFYAALTQYSESIIDEANPNYGTLILPTTLTKGRSMFYNKAIAVEWNRSDGKLGSKNSPYDLDQTHNATPITTNSVFEKAFTPSAVPAVKTYGKTDTAKLYTVCLTGISEANYSEFYSVRGYIRYIDANGFERVWYSDYYQTNMHKIANAALNKGETGEFLTAVKTYVEAKLGEGGLYDDYMAENYDNRTLLSGYPTTADTDPNHAMYQLSNGLKVRELEINYSGNENDDPVEIVHFADTHLNWINEQDLYEAIPSTISTHRGRSWNRDGASTAAITAALEYGMLFDQVVITGDVMDYFSWGCAEIMQKLILDRDKDILVAMGNHEPAENMQNDASVGSYYNGKTEIYPILQEIWPNDIYYTSKIIYNDDNQAKAMCVVLNNEQDVYIAEQGTKLAADVKVAREKGIPIFIFEHDPISTNNPDIDPVWYFYETGDWSWMKWSDAKNNSNFPKDSSGFILATPYDATIHDAMGLTPYKLNAADNLWVNCADTNTKIPASSEYYNRRGAGNNVGAKGSDDVTKAVYNVIVTNSDVIRGVFCGHVHDHMYMEIKASYTDENGNTVQQNIPQYVVTANAYKKGNVIKITVK